MLGGEIAVRRNE